MKRYSPRFRFAKLVDVIMVGVLGLLALGVVLASHFGSDQSTLGAVPSPSPSAPLTPQAAALTPNPSQPTPAAGEVVELPSSQSGDLTLVRASHAPAFSQQDAMQIVKDFGIPWGLGGRYAGKEVTVSADYGLGTFGHPGPAGMPWVGDQNIPLKGTDIVLDHIENRPVWIIDYGNVVAHGSQVTFNHAVYAVDEQTRTVLFAWFYQGA